jgi:ribosomal protein S18 acetylase RimI-like enzyme
MTGVLGEFTRWLGHAATARRGNTAIRRLVLDGATIEIRRGIASDVAALAPMIEQACSLHRQWDAAKFGFVDGAVPMYCRWLAQQADDPRSIFIVAVNSDHLFAFTIGTTERAAPIFQPASHGLIRDFWVDRDWRRRGIGQELLGATIDGFRAIGVTQIRLETAAANGAARRFFAARGFRPSTVEMLID